MKTTSSLRNLLLDKQNILKLIMVSLDLDTIMLEFLVKNRNFVGKNGINGDGDITKRDNLTEFRKFVLKQTPKGVHFVMADGVCNLIYKNTIE
jgi:hypothetical protein